MKEVERWAWWLPDIEGDVHGRRHRSGWKMTREEAMKLDPTATPVDGSREVRLMPEGPHEYQYNSKPPSPAA